MLRLEGGDPQRISPRGAGYVLLRDRFQPARGCMGRWPGCQHVGAPPPACGSGGPGGLTRTPAACRAVYVQLPSHALGVRRSELFQPARGSMGRWQGLQHAGALPPASGFGASVHAAAKKVSHTPCTCAGAAQYMFNSATVFNQPLAAWNVSKVTNMRVRCRLLVGSGGPGGLTRAPAARGGSFTCVCAVARRRRCSATRSV